MTISIPREQLLQAYSALPEAYQPAWGLQESGAMARRACEDRLAAVLPAAIALPSESQRPLRILDIGCAQGYFSLALKHGLQQGGRAAEVVGVDYLEDNVRFCEQLAAHHVLDARFIHDRFDAEFFSRHTLQDFDLVLALNVLHHIRELNGAESARAALDSIRAHSRALLCEVAQPDEALEWIGDWHESDQALLHDYAFRRRLGSYATHLGDVRRPLYACSSRLAYVGDNWFAFDEVQARAHPGVADAFAGQRRFFLGADVIIKAYHGEGDYGAFNRAELEAEAHLLETLTDEPARYPRILARCDDGEMVWLVRERLPGRLVSELIDEGISFDRDAMARGLLGELEHLQQRGWHHADIRAWNMLWHEGALRLIDFGSMIRAPSPLQRVALAAVLVEVAQAKLSHEQPWYVSPHPLADYPDAWHPLIRYLMGCDQAGFRFEDALAAFDSGAAGIRPQQTDWQELVVSTDILAISAQAQVDGFRRLQAHAADLERDLRRVAAEADAERESSTRALREATAHAASLQARLERQSAETDVEREASKQALAEAGAHADALATQIKRQNDDAAAERGAAQTALTDATRYAQSLETDRELLRNKLEQMRGRFRLLKPLWPRDKGQA